MLAFDPEVTVGLCPGEGGGRPAGFVSDTAWEGTGKGELVPTPFSASAWLEYGTSLFQQYLLSTWANALLLGGVWEPI